MKHEWQEYWKKTAQKAGKSFLLSFLATLLFYFVDLPNIPADKRLQTLLFYMLYCLSCSVGIYLCYSIVYAILTYKKLYSNLSHIKLGSAQHIVISLMGMTLGVCTASYIKSQYYGVQWHFFNQGFSFVLGAFICFALVFYFSFKETQKDNLRLSAAHAEAQLNILKNQMQPHFLFNSLNSLSELISSNTELASSLTQNLSDLYRGILELSKKQTSTLSEELTIVRQYLNIEKIRFSNRLEFQIQVPEEFHSFCIPSLLLQTLVENAIKHGISQQLRGGSIYISANQNHEGFTQIVVKNTGSVQSATTTGTQTGISNSEQRLKLLFGSSSNIRIESANNETIVTAEYPTRQAKL